MAEHLATDLLVHIDPRGAGRLQHQIYRSIRRAILSGGVSPGTRLPSSRELAHDLRVSRTTAVLALEQLLFQRTFIHPFDEIKRTFAELNRIASIMSRAAIIVAIGIR